MTLYQILDEENLTINAFQQREMALCHLDVVKELAPEHSYHIHAASFKKNDSSTKITSNLIINFG
jgi:hypothetical protein